MGGGNVTGMLSWEQLLHKIDSISGRMGIRDIIGSISDSYPVAENAGLPITLRAVTEDGAPLSALN